MNLTDWLKKNKVEPEDLDELVISAANEMASNANNDGIPYIAIADRSLVGSNGVPTLAR